MVCTLQSRGHSQDCQEVPCVCKKYETSLKPVEDERDMIDDGTLSQKMTVLIQSELFDVGEILCFDWTDGNDS